MLGRPWNGQQASVSGVLQYHAVSYMKTCHLRTGHHVPPTSSVVLPWKEVRPSTTMGVFHSMNMVLVGGQ